MLLIPESGVKRASRDLTTRWSAGATPGLRVPGGLQPHGPLRLQGEPQAVYEKPTFTDRRSPDPAVRPPLGTGANTASARRKNVDPRLDIGGEVPGGEVPGGAARRFSRRR